VHALPRHLRRQLEEDWQAEVMRRFSLPEVLEPQRSLVSEVWASACAQADGRWGGAKAGYEAQLAAGEASLAELRGEVARLAGVEQDLGARLAAREDTLH
jgi:hypothetical protein